MLGEALRSVALPGAANAPCSASRKASSSIGQRFPRARLCERKPRTVVMNMLMSPELTGSVRWNQSIDSATKVAPAREPNRCHACAGRKVCRDHRNSDANFDEQIPVCFKIVCSRRGISNQIVHVSNSSVVTLDFNRNSQQLQLKAHLFLHVLE